MSSTMCQGLQSCLEPKPRPLGLMVSDGHDFGSWSFILDLTNETKEEKESLYVHPLLKRSSSLTLSEKSLELCTESLGSETGTDISENSDISSSESCTRDRSKLHQQQFSGRNKVNCRSFPPPLTSISGSDCVHVRPHREGGRLVIKAVTVASSPTCFQAERSDGRLMLRLLKNYNSLCSGEEKEGNHEDEDEEEEEEEIEEEEEEEEIEEEEEEEVEEEEEEEIDGNNGNGDQDEIGIWKFQRPCRCKESGHGRNKGLLICKTFLVATS